MNVLIRNEWLKATCFLVLVVLGLTACTVRPNPTPPVEPPSDEFLKEGREIFRHDTFGDETFWTDVLKMNEVIETAVDPLTAAGVGLKIDAAALPDEVVEGVLGGSIPLDDPQTTLALLSLDAVVGVKGEVSEGDDGRLHLDRVGITCALCHSTVSRNLDLPVAGTEINLRGIVGLRLDGWPNRDLQAGTIISLSPALANDDRQAEYASWAEDFGPGFYDPRLNINVDPGANPALEGTDVNANLAAYKADGGDPIVIPPAFGLKGLTRSIFTGDGDTAHEPAGPVAYWNRYVAVVQMHGHGTFSDPRLVINGQELDINFIGDGGDLVTSKLPALQAYQYSIAAPQIENFPIEAAQRGVAVDGAAADRGEALFEGKAGCTTCHSGPLFTDANERLHDGTAALDDAYRSFSATGQWRTTPLGGLWVHAPYFHDGSGAFDADTGTCKDGSDIGSLASADAVTRDLACVVNRYDAGANPEAAALGLTADERADLVEYLKSL
jgi:hypothetical protein